jgi:hypothetical protein
MYRYAARLGPELGLPHVQLLAGALITARGPAVRRDSGVGFNDAGSCPYLSILRLGGGSEAFLEQCLIGALAGPRGSLLPGSGHAQG